VARKESKWMGKKLGEDFAEIVEDFSEIVGQLVQKLNRQPGRKKLQGGGRW
jgi:hypothetical protein